MNDHLIAALAATARAWGTVLVLTPTAGPLDVLAQFEALGAPMWLEQGRLRTSLRRAFTVTEAAVLNAYMAGIERELYRGQQSNAREAH